MSVSWLELMLFCLFGLAVPGPRAVWLVYSHGSLLLDYTKDTAVGPWPAGWWFPCCCTQRCCSEVSPGQRSRSRSGCHPGSQNTFGHCFILLSICRSAKAKISSLNWSFNYIETNPNKNIVYKTWTLNIFWLIFDSHWFPLGPLMILGNNWKTVKALRFF